MADAIPSSSAPDDFEPWELELIRLRVKNFLVSRRETLLEADDLRQGALLHWWLVRDRYDASRGASKQTFLRHVVDAKLLDIEREGKGIKRGGTETTLSLDVPKTAGTDLTLGDTVPVPDRTGDSDLRIDLLRASAQLTERQRALVGRMVTGQPVVAIAQALHVSRDTLYEDIKRIRQVFTDAGLQQYRL